MGKNHRAGDFVWIKIGERPPMEIRVIERTKDDRYLLDWGSCGFNSLLNTVRIPSSSLRGAPQDANHRS